MYKKTYLKGEWTHGRMSDVNRADFWEGAYQEGRDGWDLGGPTPVFQRLLRSGEFPPGRVIVLGAGRGYDAREFARHGFTVTAVDFAADAAREMRARTDPHAPLEVLQGDIFELPRALEGTFDYVLEYTCFCAIDPRRRGEYADLVARLLKPGGHFIDLAFPIGSHAGGPPFAVSVEEMLDLFRAREFVLVRRESPDDSVAARLGHEELLILRRSPASA
ncbi:MAG: methyltransferase domain-containing protein [bacterium]